MKISAYTPVIDFDFKFINIYLENLKDCKIVDEVIFVYTGKVIDFNSEIIKHKDIDVKFFNYPVDTPYLWPEGKIRNFAIDSCKNEWVLALDVDELIDEKINEIVLNEPCIYGFNFISFWYDLKTMRVNVPKDNHWYPNKIHRLYHKSLVKYNTSTYNHSTYPISNSWIKDIDLFCYHLHYVDQFNGSILKPRDNRSYDFNKYHENIVDNSEGILLKKEDYFYLEQFKNGEKNFEFKTIPYTGKYPKCLEKYID